MADSGTSTGSARSARRGSRGVGRRNRTSNPAVIKRDWPTYFRLPATTVDLPLHRGRGVAVEYRRADPPIEKPECVVVLSERCERGDRNLTVPVTKEVEPVGIGVPATESCEVGIQTRWMLMSPSTSRRRLSSTGESSPGEAPERLAPNQTWRGVPDASGRVSSWG
jgi:hypothetical protein